jgi:hypothetical protein
MKRDERTSRISYLSAHAEIRDVDVLCKRERNLEFSFIKEKSQILFVNSISKMQPTYLYSSEFDQEVQWRSKFSIIIPIIIGLAQMILTFAIVGLEIASVVITPIEGTLYAGFWLSVLFTLSWIAMFTLGIQKSKIS